jgi:hypothetical protein
MASGVFQSAPGLNYEMENIEAVILDPGDSPTVIIDDDLEWKIRVTWKAVGAAVAWKTGKVTVDAFVESMGPGVEKQLTSAFVDIKKSKVDYEAMITVAAGDVAIPAGQSSIAVKLTTTLTAKDLGGNVIPMAGFVEGPILQFFKKTP